MSEGDVCIVVGVGPGNGESLSRKFASEGYRVAALARSGGRLRELVGGIDGVTPYTIDATNAEHVEETCEQIESTLGPPEVVLYNAGAGAFGTFDEVDAGDLQQAWEVNTLGLYHFAEQVLPGMRERGSGVLGVTGATATTRGKPFTTAFAQAKAAQHHLAESLAREFGPQGIHVFYFIVDGVIDLPRTREAMPDKEDDFFLQPDEIAHSVYEVAHQPKSAWTFEFDLRPYCEDW